MEKRAFSVLLIGLSQHDERVLTSTFLLSGQRSRSYTLINNMQERPAEILIVDTDAQHAVAKWQGYISRNPNVHSVLVTSKPLTDTKYFICRPIVANRVLRILDQLTVNEFQFFPELVIKDSGSPGDSSLQDLTGNPQLTATSSNGEHRLKALVVDDSPVVRTLMDVELRMLSLNVDFADSVTQATSLIAQNTYDIVFLDVVLPDGDGYQLSKLIKHDKLKRKTPVIMLTGKSSPFDRVRGRLAGCDAYIPKPAKHDTLQKVIREHLRPAAPARSGFFK
jgi:twitching motility two-component system response regulator PilG